MYFLLGCKNRFQAVINLNLKLCEDKIPNTKESFNYLFTLIQGYSIRQQSITLSQSPKLSVHEAHSLSSSASPLKRNSCREKQNQHYQLFITAFSVQVKQDSSFQHLAPNIIYLCLCYLPRDDAKDKCDFLARTQNNCVRTCSS